MHWGEEREPETETDAKKLLNGVFTVPVAFLSLSCSEHTFSDFHAVS